MRQLVSIKLVALFFLTVTSAWSQDNVGPLARKWSVGFDVGYSESRIFGSYADFAQRWYGSQYKRAPEWLSRKAVMADLTVYKKLFSFVYIKSGVGYTRHGGGLTNTSLVFPMDITLDYITVPLGVGVNPRIFKSVSVALDGGFCAGFELSSSQDFQKGVAPGIPQTNNTFIPNYFWSGSVLYPINARCAVKAAYRYVKALKPFYENGEGEYLTEESSKANAFSAGIVYVVK
ncbi:PQQ-binding-like beta-propeller repeat protein [Dawidia soli]|uniref:Uncharacterized protein n=1 Tax=Dawidia soli TaxID=2782352 RepID=A0AAP2DBN9_9BACT|nr:hypothetical protein [Dawidia soli]MBT1688994.1 hypothetical protein [Dawidia soli]